MALRLTAQIRRLSSSNLLQCGYEQIGIYAAVGRVFKIAYAHSAGDYKFIFQSRFNVIGNRRRKGYIPSGRFRLYERLQKAACRVRGKAAYGGAYRRIAAAKTNNIKK